MEIENNPFVSECKDIDNGNFLHFINIQEIDENLRSFIDESIVSICEGNIDTDLATIKNRLVHFLEPKIGSNIELGAIAEFFNHLYLRALGFKQEFLFLNLEEESIKKGFDGYYTIRDEEWIFESKSGKISTANISHKAKIKEAYDDLKSKLSGDVKNNPWKNAFNHARIIDVGSSTNVRESLKRFSDDFTNEHYHDINDFNIIPGSTIFLEENWETIDSEDLELRLKELIDQFEFQKINIICINKMSLRLFWDYLNN